VKYGRRRCWYCWEIKLNKYFGKAKRVCLACNDLPDPLPIVYIKKQKPLTFEQRIAEYEKWENSQDRKKKFRHGKISKNKRTICNTAEWKALRVVIIEKYNNTCCCCSATGKEAQIQVDHIKPKSKYPELAFNPDNLQLLCRRCNFAKNTLHETDYRKH